MLIMIKLISALYNDSWRLLFTAPCAVITLPNVVIPIVVALKGDSEK